jgi:hypothetical protein
VKKPLRLILAGWLLTATSLFAEFVTILDTANSPDDSGNAQNHVITMPSGIDAGEFLITFFTVDGNNSCSTSNSNWQEIADVASTSTVTYCIYWKRAEGGDSLTVTVTAFEQSTAITVLTSAIDPGIDPTVTCTTGSSANADPPNHNPGVARDWTWIASAGIDLGTVPTAAPTNYTNLITEQSVDSAASTGIARRQLNASAENPGTFTSSNEQWVGCMVSIPPAPGVAYPAAIINSPQVY